MQYFNEDDISDAFKVYDCWFVMRFARLRMLKIR